jgi:hypothetical protein
LHAADDAERVLKRPLRPDDRMLLDGCDASSAGPSGVPASAMQRAPRPRAAPRRGGGAGREAVSL